MAIPAQRHHPWLRYSRLVLGAWTLRLLIIIRSWLQPKQDTQLFSAAMGVMQSRIMIPSREAGRSIRVDLYQKRDTAAYAKRYAHLNFHGSGFVVPSLGTDMEFCTALASVGTIVFDADYRKAPEYPFPACYEDAQDVINFIQNQYEQFDASHITVSGFSAGANLAMALSVNLPVDTIAGVVSFYGNTDMTTVYPAPDPRNFDSGAVLPEWLRRFFYRCYILPDQDRSDSRLSPAKAALARWPKHVLMICGTADSLHESSRVVIENLKKHKHPDAQFLSVEQGAHGFDKDRRVGSRAKIKKDSIYKAAIDTIRRAQGN